VGGAVTLQRRLLLLLLLSAPLVWGAGLLYGLSHARLEINELFDTQQIQLARQVLSTLPAVSLPEANGAASVPALREPAGDADLDDLSIAVWNREGRLLLVDREALPLPAQPTTVGFVDMTLDGEAWRVYYLPATSGEWHVAVGQKHEERDELVWSVIAGQLVPWVLTLPFLLLAMAGAVRHALKPVRALTSEIERRGAADLHPLTTAEMPTDLQPLLDAMNTLLARIAQSNERERRFIADAAHELRTPLAALQAQWDARRLQAAAPPHFTSGVAPGVVPADSQDLIAQGLERLSRLVSQLLSLSRLEQADLPDTRHVDWPRLVERVFSDLLPLAEKRGVELECTWPPAGQAPMPLSGDEDLLAALLRNLLDNAVRHSSAGQMVTLQVFPDAVEVLDDGPGVADEHLARLGDRFFRAPGQDSTGSGLGLSIVKRIAGLHGLQVDWRPRDNDSGGHRGFVVRLSRSGSPVLHAH